MESIVGRAKELQMLREYIASPRSEFVAVYGRRRVGKTFLIRQAVNDNFSFYVTGLHGGNLSRQLIGFAVALQKYSHAEELSVDSDWMLAFHSLGRYLETLPAGPKVVFIDEMPWMDTPKSGFIPALENFWNSWAAQRDDVKLIVCGSATSWMLNNLIHNRGGLHNRLTHYISLEPFTLNECEEYFTRHGFGYSRGEIAECYMVLGGIPFYLSLMRKQFSLSQNIDRLFFSPMAELKDEFGNLYQAIFKKASHHIAVVTALAKKRMGMTRAELLAATKLAENGAFSTVLEELVECGFIRRYEPYSETTRINKEKNSKNTLYQLIDFYTLFYFNFINDNVYNDEQFWSTSVNSPLHHAWAGLAFEMLCLHHVRQIKQALGIAAVQTRVCSWRSSGKDANGAQIDLLIDRKDKTINICEIKYTTAPFAIDKKVVQELQNKIHVFSEETGTRKSLLLTLITANGLKDGMYSGFPQCVVGLEQLFLA